VIPLYQKALLEEAIAKREIELKEATATLALKERALAAAGENLARANVALEETNSELARAQLLNYLERRNTNLFAFIFNSGAECTGLLRRSRELLARPPVSAAAI
jgi:hypothetical protein